MVSCAVFSRCLFADCSSFPYYSYCSFLRSCVFFPVRLKWPLCQSAYKSASNTQQQKNEKAPNTKTRLLRIFIDRSYELQYSQRSSNFSFSILVFDASECALRGCVVLLRVCFFLFLISPHTSHSSTRFHRQRVRVRKRHEMGHTYSFQLRVLNVNVSMASEQRADHFRAKHFSVNLLVRCPNTICIVHLGSGKSRPTYLKWADRFGKILISNLSTMNFWKLTRLLIVKAKDDGSMDENMTLECQSANSYCLAEQVENRFDLHGRSTNNLLQRKVITFSFDAQAKLLSFSKNFVFLLFHKADDIFRCVLLLLSMSNSPNESKQTNFTLFTCIDHRNKHYHWQWESILSTWARFGCCGNSISTPMNPNKIQCQTNAEMTVIIGQKGKTRHSAFVMADEICNFFEIRPTQCKQVTFRSKHRQI